jgi:hypothetical protein
MTRKLILFFAIFLVIGGTIFSQSQERNRRLYIDFGLGFGDISYNGELDDALESAKDNGFDRVMVALDLSIGWAISQKWYIVGSITGLGDRLYYLSDYIQLNTYLIGPGIRLYPLPSGKYLQLGVDFGMGRMVSDSNVDQVDGLVSEPGIGVKVSAAYDFDSTLTGFTFLLGAEFLADFIEDETICSVSLFGKFAFK